MKYLVMTSPDSQGNSEVFYSLLMPEDSAPNDLVTRWDKLVDNSPITVVSSIGKDNLGIDAIWNEDSKEFSKPEDKILRSSKPRESKTYSFLIENQVVSIITVNEDFGDDSKLVAGFSDPVVIKSVSDESPVDLGYIWDGTVFTPPTDN
jgi:hypothetical protein